jgi:hypothetical protein
MNETDRKKRAEECARRAGAALGIDYEEKEVRHDSAVVSPAGLTPALPTVAEKVAAFLVDALHLAAHKREPLELATVIEQAEKRYAEEKIDPPPFIARVETAPRYR